MQAKSTTFDPGANGQDATADSTSPALATVDKPRSGVARELHSFVADIEDLIKATTSLTGEDLAKARAKLTQRVEAAKQSVGRMSDEIALRTREGVRATDDYVHEQPWKAIGMGAAAGLLLGLVLARRR